MGAAPFEILVGDCREQLAAMPAESVHAVVTDPPYEIAFMGRAWDATGVAFDPETWAACLRVLKPGGHLLAFGATRTVHRIACAIEDAGFEIRDQIAWLYGSGFPKSRDVAASIDRLDATDERRRRDLAFTAWMRSTGVSSGELNRITESRMGGHWLTEGEQPGVPTAEFWAIIRAYLLGPAVAVDEIPEWVDRLVHDREVESVNWAARAVTGVHDGYGLQEWNSRLTGSAPLPPRERRDEPATDEARAWQGWGTTLKPACEPIVLARKPFKGSTARNVLAHGTGALNVAACRIGSSGGGNTCPGGDACSCDTNAVYGGTKHPERDTSIDVGRWPANVMLDPEAAELLDAAAGVDGGASRFFYIAKPTRAEKDAGLAHRARAFTPTMGKGIGSREHDPDDPRSHVLNSHATVKPVTLMREIVRLVTPPDGIVLDPFTGSGTTGIAALVEGFRFVGIELDPDHAEIATSRIRHWAALPLDEADRLASAEAAPAGVQLDLLGGHA